MANQAPLFTRTVKAGKRTYYIDVRDSKSGDDVLITITEQKRGAGEPERHQIFVYKENLEKILEALEEAMEFVNERFNKMKIRSQG